MAYLRRELVSPVAERVYVDMESSRIGAIVAEAGSRRFWKARWRQRRVAPRFCYPRMPREGYRFGVGGDGGELNYTENAG